MCPRPCPSPSSHAGTPSLTTSFPFRENRAQTRRGDPTETVEGKEREKVESLGAEKQTWAQVLGRPEEKEGEANRCVNPGDRQLGSPPPWRSGVAGGESALSPTYVFIYLIFFGGERVSLLEFSRLLRPRGTLRAPSPLPRARGGQGRREGGKHPLSPPPSRCLVMHFLRPRIPFVLKFWRIRLRCASSGAGARLAGEGIPQWAWRLAPGPPPSRTLRWALGRLPSSREPCSPQPRSFAETELARVVSPTWRAEPNAGGSVGSL